MVQPMKGLLRKQGPGFWPQKPCKEKPGILELACYARAWEVETEPLGLVGQLGQPVRCAPARERLTKQKAKGG